MTTTAPPTATPPGSRARGGTPAAVAAVARAAVAAPCSRRAWAELAHCLLGFPLGLAGFVAVVVLVGAGAALTATVAGAVAGLPLLAAALAAGRGLGALHRRLAGRLLAEPVAAPAPPGPGRGLPGRLGVRLRDAAGWRALAYQLLKLPLSLLGWYAAAVWVSGLVDLSYPVWWQGFRNHPPGTRLRPLPVVTLLPMAHFRVATFPGTLAAVAVGAAALLLAPWPTRAVVAADRRLVRGLLGPGGLATRVRDLELTRALAVDDAAARLRRLERDLHDGAQARLVAVAMSLGLAREKLGEGGEPPDPARARQLLASAHRNATEAIAELRDLARGIHPPVLDGGLADALATLAARSAVPVEVSVDVPVRPTAAIETIAYFCAAELLANVSKHSGARRATVRAAQRDGLLRLRVGDDGSGGARLVAGGGLAGLAQRVRTVDGSLAIASPAGGPTVVTVELPLHA
jgi:signal transduction histidine kinase